MQWLLPFVAGAITDGDLVEAFQAIVGKPNAFAFPIEHIKPKR